jgi:hypothetical protein
MLVSKRKSARVRKKNPAKSTPLAFVGLVFDVIFSLAEKKSREKEHVTVACVVSAGGSEDDDSGEALTITVVIISTSSNARAQQKKPKKEKN